MIPVPAPRLTRSSESARLVERLLASLPAASLELETFARLAGIEASGAVPTAAVTCVGRPRLLLNPDFVARHCSRDEHLALLVLHELWHVLLAHTRLYPRATPAQNVALDAIINAGLRRNLRDPVYAGFFEALNPADAFPACLLRPPEGWPVAPRYPDGLGPKGTAALVARLYPPDASGATPTAPPPTYAEIRDLLERHRRVDGPVILLGDHDETDERDWLRDRLLRDLFRQMVRRWSKPPVALTEPDASGAVPSWLDTLQGTDAPVRAAFARVLRRVLGPAPTGIRRRRRELIVDAGGSGVLPWARDRQHWARRRLGGPVTLWAQPVARPARVPAPPAGVHIYLDVSGSMAAVLPTLLDLLRPYAEAGTARVFQFSTVVVPLAPADLVRGRLATTFGTDLEPVLLHLLAARSVRRALLLTDGLVGQVRAARVRALAARRIAVHAVLPAEGSRPEALTPLAASITVLRSFGTRSTWSP